MSFRKDSFLQGVHVVGSVADDATLDRLKDMDIPAMCDALEFRVDAYPDRIDAAAAAMKACPVPVLLTVRAPLEGGLNGLDERQRRLLIEQLLPCAQLVDIEINNLRPDPLLDRFRQHGIIIGSFHEFGPMPSIRTLHMRMGTGVKLGADLVKIAVHVPDVPSLAKLTSLFDEDGHPPLSLMGMGPFGRVSRLLCAQMGSVLNYGYLDHPTVPGQWPAAELRRLIREGSV